MRVTMAILTFLFAHPLVAAETELADQFREPPPRFRPLVILHSMPLDRADAIKQLSARRAGGAVIDVGVTPGSRSVGQEQWNNLTYLNDSGRFKRLRGVVDSMRQSGLQVWLYDELGYPSGSAGGRVLDGHPEFQVQVVGCRTLKADRETAVELGSQHGRLVACYALPRDQDRLNLQTAIELTAQARQGNFSWSAPDEREWSVCIFERFPPDTWRRHNIPRRNVNILDRRAVSRFIELTHQRYATQLGDQLADVDAFFTDEPQLGSAEHWTGGNVQCLPMIQWCDELPGAFYRQKGYGLVESLPALFHDVGSRTSKLRYDFYDVQSDLVAENYFGQIGDWCDAHGVASTGHMLLEESLLFHVMFSGSMMKNWARMDLPGVDLLGASPYKTMAGWERGRFGVPEDFSCKMASSVAHLTGKQGVFTESYALVKDIPLRRALGIAAWQFSGGVTHMTTYSVQHELSADDYARLSDFVGRLAVLTRRGRHVADVAVLVPESSVWASYTPPHLGRFEGYFDCNPEPLAIDRVFRSTCHCLSSRQRDFDCLSESLLQQATANDGSLEVGGERFRVLLLPEVRMLDHASFGKIREFLQGGGQVAFIGSLPYQSPQRGDDPKLTVQASRLLTEFAGRAWHLKDLNRWSELAKWMDERVPPTVAWKGERSVRLLHRQESEREILLLANPGRTDAAGTLTAPAAGNASLWNPETGHIQQLHEVDVSQEISVQVPAESARFIVVSRR
jgi:hypothetical protein